MNQAAAEDQSQKFLISEKLEEIRKRIKLLRQKNLKLSNQFGPSLFTADNPFGDRYDKDDKSIDEIIDELDEVNRNAKSFKLFF